jgi:hypothetical protein
MELSGVVQPVNNAQKATSPTIPKTIFLIREDPFVARAVLKCNLMLGISTGARDFAMLVCS